VVRDAFGTCGVGLIDVDSLDGTAESEGLAADGVVEDEDFGSSGAISISTWRAWRVFAYLRLLQQLCFGVVDAFDLLVIEEVLLFTLMLDDLEPLGVQGVLRLIATDIMDYSLLWLGWSGRCLWLTNITRCRGEAIFIILEIIQDGVDFVGSNLDVLISRTQLCSKTVIMLALSPEGKWNVGLLFCCRCHFAFLAPMSKAI
jgi:hypothetical protein